MDIVQARSEYTPPVDFIKNISRLENVIEGVVDRVEVEELIGAVSDQKRAPTVNLNEYCKKKERGAAAIVYFSLKNYKVLRANSSDKELKGNGAIYISSLVSNTCTSALSIISRKGMNTLFLVDRYYQYRNGVLVVPGYEFFTPMGHENAPKGWLKYDYDLLEFIQNPSVASELLKLL
ncbi:hypothetical protein WAE56_02445 [Iodobacter sp. LRB]|uniref:hypothetical protein n=1 Tax=unclassified Iodobacter TaxID=235634 RepID=UPI00117A18C1|nr:hypothetical protein [Iodobacter sp. BJB302]